LADAFLPAGRKAWPLTNDPQAELDWLRADIYGDDRGINMVKVPATRRYSSRLWAE
jgi:hypothetical protein